MPPLIKRNIPTIIFVILVYVWFLLFQAKPQTTNLNVLGANTNTLLFVQPGAGREPILNAVNNAHSEILVEMYLLSDRKIIDSLDQARERGVKVAVMLEQHPFGAGGGNLNTRSKNMLIKNGVAVKWTNPKFALTHEKTLVIDNKEALILGQNLTTSSFSKNREYDVLDTNPQDVTEARNIFIADWKNKSFTPPSTHLIISPDNSRPAITSLIENARNSLDIETEDIDDPQIVMILSSKCRQIKVRFIVPTFSQIKSNKNAVMKLIKGGCLVKSLTSPYMHAKLILADDTKAYIGSVNLSTQSLDENREVGIMLTQNDILFALSSTFEKDWENGSAL